MIILIFFFYFQLVQEAFQLFQAERAKSDGTEKSDDMNAFYNTPPNVRLGTTSLIAKAVVNNLLEGEVTGIEGQSCAIS
jgi:hypothetical protein